MARPQTAFPPSFSTFTYECHRPEQTPLYGLIETYYPRFLQHIEAERTSLPRFVKDEWLGRIENTRPINNATRPA